MSDIETITLTLSENIKEKFVAYDDHLADKKKETDWRDKALKKVSDLVARQDEEIDRLKAENENLSCILSQLPTSPGIIAKIKAEGIREMLGELDMYDVSPNRKMYLVDDLLEWLENLESK